MAGDTFDQPNKRRKVATVARVTALTPIRRSESILISSSPEPEEHDADDDSITEISPPRPSKPRLSAPRRSVQSTRPRSHENSGVVRNTVDLTEAESGHDSDIEEGSSDSDVLIVSEFSRTHPDPVIPRPPPGARPAVAKTVPTVTKGVDENTVIYFGALNGCYAVGPRSVHISRNSASRDAVDRTGSVAAKLRGPDPQTSTFTLHDQNGSLVGNVGPEHARLIRDLLKIRGGIRLETNMCLWQEEAPAQAAAGGDQVYFPFFINIYGPKRLLGQVTRELEGDGRELDQVPNPGHRIMRGVPIRPGARRHGTLSGYSYEFAPLSMRDEEIANMFDSLDAEKEWPEMEQDDMVMTPLIRHQKQGLYFMTAHEKIKQYTGDIEDEKTELWKKHKNALDADVYSHIITQRVVPDKPDSVRGGMLADMMGLGKTLQILSLIASTKKESEKFGRSRHIHVMNTDPKHQYFSTRNTRATLVICPTSVMSNWEEQILAHIKPDNLKVHFYGRDSATTRIRDPSIIGDNDVVFVSYGAVRAEYAANDKGKHRNPLHELRWFRVVLDEAHAIRNFRTVTAEAVFHLDAERRWALTGTPIQNQLDDLYTLLKFLQVAPFNDYGIWKHNILKPLKTGNSYAVAHLRLLVHSITLRRLKDKIELPEGRVDKVVELELTSTEQEIHDVLLAASENRIRQMEVAGVAAFQQRMHLLTMMLRMRLVSCHGRELLGDQEDWATLIGSRKESAIELDSEVTLTLGTSLSPARTHEFFNLLVEAGDNRCQYCGIVLNPPALDGNEQEGESSEDNENSAATGKRKRKSSKAKKTKGPKDDIIGHMTPCTHLLCDSCLPVYYSAIATPFTTGMRVHCPICNVSNRMTILPLRATDIKKYSPDTTQTIIRKKTIAYRGPSSKAKALVADLLDNREKSTEKGPIRSVVFTSWTAHMDLIEIAFAEKGIRWVRLDGSMKALQRKKVIEEFRKDARIEVFLISITAGGLGLNLTDACRCYIMEPQYNPAVEAQALDRIHRLGQKREVVCVRYIMKNSFEEKVVNLQQKKVELADMTLSGEKLTKEQQLDKLKELKDLFIRNMRD